MAFFKFRKAAGESVAPPPAPESVEAIRKRARYRLAGAALLVLAGVIGFPLLFDNQPRPIAVDIPIDIPDKAKVKPLTAEAAATTAAPVASSATPDAGAAPVAATTAPAGKEEKEEVIVSASSPAQAEDKPAAEPQPKAKPVEKPAAKPAEKVADKATEKPADKAVVGRFVVQFGAFTDAALAREARVKVERSGMKTYAQIAETPAGKKIRVRVGPFEKRSEAEKAAEKIKKAGLPAAILEL